jgi:hypothetical protein
VLVPVAIWLYNAAPELWHLGFLGKCMCLLTVGSTAADMAFLAAANLTEPGILPTTLVDDSVAEEEEAPNGSGGWYMGMAPPTERGQHYRIIIYGQRYHLIEFRAKFCRETENCIENFDHYCPWVGNAVGRRNYRFFVLFVAGANLVAACVLGGSLAVAVAIAQANGGGVAMAVALAPVPIFLIVYTVIILMTVGGLLGYHVGLISSNTTTNESIKGLHCISFPPFLPPSFPPSLAQLLHAVFPSFPPRLRCVPSCEVQSRSCPLHVCYVCLVDNKPSCINTYVCCAANDQVYTRSVGGIRTTRALQRTGKDSLASRSRAGRAM